MYTTPYSGGASFGTRTESRSEPEDGAGRLDAGAGGRRAGVQECRSAGIRQQLIEGDDVLQSRRREGRDKARRGKGRGR